MAVSVLTLQSVIGVFAIPFIAWCLSEHRLQVKLQPIVFALAIQIVLALALTQFPWSQQLFGTINRAVLALDGATRNGTSFLFGYLGGAPLPFKLENNASSFVLAFQALPLIIVLSALTALLTYLRILPLLISAIAKFLKRYLSISAPTAFACAANIFVGMVESPLFIKPYLKALSRSELFVVMTVGMATIAGTVMVIYVGFLQTRLPGAAGHLLTASIISIPAAISIALTMVPKLPGASISNIPLAQHQADHPADRVPGHVSKHKSVMDAIVGGTQDGLKLCLEIAALLVVFVALVSLLNVIIAALIPDAFGQPISLEGLVGVVMIPFAWLIGIPWTETMVAGKLLGTKLMLNEFIALRALGDIEVNELSNRSILILSYALSGFANMGSLGILIGGLTTMAPERRDEIIALAPKALISGTLSTLLTGAIIGLMN